jgi:hypothetical protein
MTPAHSAPSYSSLLLPTARRCTDCDERTRWAQTPTGRPVLIDAEPHPAGDLVLVLTGTGTWIAERRRGYRARALRESGHQLYRYHRCGL